jgi:DNA (cytosine-5)-methyltransferase 1
VRPRLLDLFCYDGGAAMGYYRAGFEVVGVDIFPRPRYPFEFHQADALTFPLDGFDVIHASPPCQAHSTLRHLWKEGEYVDLIAATRDRLEATGRPYIIENVVGAPLRGPVLLCGSMFGLGANGRQLRRHRLFESNRPIGAPGPCSHVGQPVGVYGHGGGGQMTRGYKGTRAEYQEAMGINWTTKTAIAQAVPPAYTEWIGGELIRLISE